MIQRHARNLAELTELGMALARKVQAAALDAEDAGEAAALTAAFHRISRSVRQSMALEARLKRDAARSLREDADASRAERQRRIAARKDQIRAIVRGMVWSEAEAGDCSALVAELDDRLLDAEHRDDFLHEAVEACIARLRADLGLEPGVAPARRRTAAAANGPSVIEVRFIDPTPGLELDADHFRSSA